MLSSCQIAAADKGDGPGASDRLMVMGVPISVIAVTVVGVRP